MKKYTMDDFITGKLAVQVNGDNIMDFLKMCEEKGLVWESGDNAIKGGNVAAKCIACGFVSANKLTFSRLEVPTAYFDAGYTFVDFSQIIKPVRYQILIESDGDTTTAKMIVNGEEVKQATAKRNPADKANWRTGAQVAFDRLWKKQEKPEKEPEKEKEYGGFKVGDRVVIDSPDPKARGKHGMIVAFDNALNLFCVEFDEHVYNHNCDGKTKAGHGCYALIEHLTHEQPTKPQVREVKRQAKAGEYIKLTKKMYSFDKVGLILRADKADACTLVLQKNHPTCPFDKDPDFEWAYKESGYVVLEGYQPGRDA